MTSPETTNLNSSFSPKKIDYRFTAVKLEEAIEHLQKLLNQAKAEDLTDSWYAFGLAHAIIDLNEGFNRRYPERQETMPYTDSDKIPWEIVVEWSKLWKKPIETIDDIIFKKV